MIQELILAATPHQRWPQWSG